MKIGAFVLGSCLVASAAQAGLMQLSQTAYSSGNGGEFRGELIGAAFTPMSLSGNGFETFCLERGENFSPGGIYHYDVNIAATLGGGGSSGGMDPLDERTAYIYRLFISGSLVGYDYANAFGQRSNNAGSLQNVIWYLEQEVGSLDSADAVSWYALAQNGIGLGLGDVRVLNLYNLNDVGERIERQDQIVRVPAPGALALSLGGVAMILRRRR
ncbi:MAG: hypothetical protein AABZ53_16725 [Planctomycetota bacterium]